MLKKILEKTAFEALHEELQKLYGVGADGKYHLKLEDDDAEPLRRAKEHEAGLRKIAERDLEAARTELAAAQGKVEELTKSQSSSTLELRADHEKAVQKLKEEHDKKTKALEDTIKKIFVNDVASTIAKDIAVDDGAAELLSEVIRKRLTVEMVNGEPVTRVMAADGTASNMTPDELKNEYFTNEKYAGIMRASDASGGGASNGKKSGGATYKTLDDLGDAERTKLQKENPAEWQRLVDAKRQAVGA